MKTVLIRLLRIILIISIIFSVLLEIVGISMLSVPQERTSAIITIVFIAVIGLFLPFKLLKKLRVKKSTVAEINDFHENKKVKQEQKIEDIKYIVEEKIVNEDTSYQSEWQKKYVGIKNGKKVYKLALKEYISSNKIDLQKLKELSEIELKFSLSKGFTKRINNKYLVPLIKQSARELIFSNSFTKNKKEIIEKIPSIICLDSKVIQRIMKNQSIEYFYYKKNLAIEDQRITPEEEKELISIAKKLNLSEEDIHLSSVEERQLALYKLYYEIEQGNLPDINSSVPLTKGEICHYESPATRIESKKRVVGYQGRSSGVSVRIAKGVTVRTGSFRGHPITQEYEIEHNGTLTITNKRLIFVSRTKGFTAPIQNIVGLEGYSNGIGIQHNQKYYLMKCEYPELVSMLITASINNK